MEATDSTKQNRLASAMMSETHHTYTENGAKASDTSGDALVDLFGVIGALRQRDEEDIVRVFSKAYDASPELAMRILFYARDIRGEPAGAGRSASSCTGLPTATQRR